MSIKSYLPLQSALHAGAFIVLALAVAFLVAAIVGWRGPYRKKRLIRFALCLGAVPLFPLFHSGIYAVFAFVLFFIPERIWPLYGVQVHDQYARFLSQHNSIFLGGIAIIAFLCRNIEANNGAKRTVIVGLFWTNMLGVVVTLYACLTGVFVGFGWSDPAFSRRWRHFVDGN